jgi:hypothetical protein
MRNKVNIITRIAAAILVLAAVYFLVDANELVDGIYRYAMIDFRLIVRNRQNTGN